MSSLQVLAELSYSLPKQPVKPNFKDHLTADLCEYVCMCVLCVHQDYQLNRVVMEEGAGAEPSPAGARPKKKNRKTYDLTGADKFWQKHKGRLVLLVEGFWYRL